MVGVEPSQWTAPRSPSRHSYGHSFVLRRRPPARLWIGARAAGRFNVDSRAEVWGIGVPSLAIWGIYSISCTSFRSVLGSQWVSLTPPLGPCSHCEVVGKTGDRRWRRLLRTANSQPASCWGATGCCRGSMRSRNRELAILLRLDECHQEPAAVAVPLRRPCRQRDVR